MNNKSSEEAKVEQTLYAFIAEMNKWEVECWNRKISSNLSIAERNKMNLDEVESIFSKFCTEREKSTFRSASYQNPPEYDPINEKLLEMKEEKKNKFVVITQQTTGFKNKHRYTLELENEVFKLSKKEYLQVEGGWKRKSL